MVPQAGAPPPQARALSEALAWYAHARAVFSGGNEVQLLRGGDALFPAMIEAIDHALREVWLATYIYEDDAAARAVSAALEAAARRGVRVRVVVDGFGSQHALAALRELLEPAGVALAVFRPTQRWWSWLQPGQLRRLHQKLCVVDGQIGFVGGINVLDDRHDIHHGWGDVPRLDYAVRLRGPVVGPVEQTARAMWTRAAFGRDWRDEVREIARSRRPMASARRLLRRLRIAVRRRSQGSVGESALQPVRAAFVVRDNLRQRRSIERSYIDALRRAQQRIDIVSAYFYPGFEFRRALLGAARRGVSVRLLLQGKADYRLAALAAQALYDELLAHGVGIFEYTPAFLHAKVALVDQRWATVGSSNIDPLSLLVNLEANVFVDDREFAATLSRELDRDFAAAREITAPLPLAGWQRWLRRGFVAWVARLYLRAAGASGRY
ncbi:cardiolipin synthase ClsB [Methylibium sp.]|uniref:cardiolipin synthase ClsB n=1 Tax=Methylibium sp. TaxID=2067992 RepID=UPI003D140C34